MIKTSNNSEIKVNMLELFRSLKKNFNHKFFFEPITITYGKKSIKLLPNNSGFIKLSGRQINSIKYYNVNLKNTKAIPDFKVEVNDIILKFLEIN